MPSPRGLRARGREVHRQGDYTQGRHQGPYPSHCPALVPPEDGVGHTWSLFGRATRAGVPSCILADACPNLVLAVNVRTRALSLVEIEHYRAPPLSHPEVIWGMHHAHPRVQASHLHHPHREPNQLLQTSRVHPSDG